jgi:hypothetical protein
MRAGLRRFIAHHGKNGYHVTITEFWLERVERLVAGLRERQEGLVPLVNSVVERCSDKTSSLRILLARTNRLARG